MMFMLERFDCKKLELAMLLDEPPYHNFQASTSCGEPWRADGPLVRAAMSIDTDGYAWLYVAYISDKPSTWGTKELKLMSGGTILRRDVNNSGAWTGSFAKLSFETVAPIIFRNIIGEPTCTSYNIVYEARITEGPEGVPDDVRGDELLGREEGQVDESEKVIMRFLPAADLGILITWQNEDRKLQKNWRQRFYSSDLEKWWVPRFGDCRFGLTEYQRRPYVQLLLARLGFVEDGQPGTADKRAVGLSEFCSGHLRNIVVSLRAVKSSLQKEEASGGRFEDTPDCLDAIGRCEETSDGPK